MKTVSRTLAGVAAAGVIVLTWPVAIRADEPKAPAADPPKVQRTIVDALVDDAKAVSPLVESAAVKQLLAAARDLPVPNARTLYRNREKGVVVTSDAYAAMPPEQQATLTKREYPPEFYYLTGYGSPMMYARPLDLYARATDAKSFANLKVLDFGYGGVGPLRLLASVGAKAHGVDVEPLFAVYYAQPGDIGPIEPSKAASASVGGSIAIHTGRWPAEKTIVEAVGGGFDLFISKNTLKRGYIHPASEVDERMLVKLGVSDEQFVKAVHDALKPGGVFLIYNLCPKQNPADKPYLPHADGECPFPRELLEKSGFEIVAFDRDDKPAAVDFWMALGFNDGQPKEAVASDLFVWYTLARKK